MLTKAELKHGAYYHGECRNAGIARWNAETSRFVYIRHKFGDRFPEEINHPEDDDGFDLFEPDRECESPPREIPLTT